MLIIIYYTHIERRHRHIWNETNICNHLSGREKIICMTLWPKSKKIYKKLRSKSLVNYVEIEL